ncbi:hypothetical protein [Paraburkholderia sp. BL6669N2]|uniref:hypothetical protein n=1 Tax=Paraburkholderia sp. BL6669N2 TaxID=1938807 RepID=UPI0011C0602E|nr:hypothetical protein [Paraburkholderia sp. BL6669N2]
MAANQAAPASRVIRLGSYAFLGQSPFSKFCPRRPVFGIRMPVQGQLRQITVVLAVSEQIPVKSKAKTASGAILEACAVVVVKTLCWFSTIGNHHAGKLTMKKTVGQYVYTITITLDNR